MKRKNKNKPAKSSKKKKEQTPTLIKWTVLNACRNKKPKITAVVITIMRNPSWETNPINCYSELHTNWDHQTIMITNCYTKSLCTHTDTHINVIKIFMSFIDMAVSSTHTNSSIKINKISELFFFSGCAAYLKITLEQIF